MSTDVKRLVVGLTELSEFDCQFGWYCYRSSCLGFAFSQIINMREREDLGRQTG